MTGTFDGTTFSLDAKSGVISTFVDGTMGVTYTQSYTTLIRGNGWLATMFVLPAGTPNMMTVPSVNLTFGNNGGLTGVVGAGTFTPSGDGPRNGIVTGTQILNANFGGGTMPFLYIPIYSGFAGTTLFNGGLSGGLYGDNFHTNMITQVGSTSAGLPIAIAVPTSGNGTPMTNITAAQATGGVSTGVDTATTASGATLMNVDIVTLVTIHKTRSSGQITITLSAPTSL